MPFKLSCQRIEQLDLSKTRTLHECPPTKAWSTGYVQFNQCRSWVKPTSKITQSMRAKFNSYFSAFLAS